MAVEEEHRPDLKGDGWDPEPLLSVHDVARLLGLSKSAVYELPIPRVRVAKRAVRWRPEVVRRFIERREGVGA